MAENVQITPGTGVTIGADSVTDITLGSAQIQYIKIMDGTIGGTNKAEVTANGLAVDGSGVTQPISAVSLPLPSGASTSANQATEISYLSTIATNTANAGTPTVSGTVTVIQPTAANLNATVTQTIAGNLVTEAWINDGSGNAISSTGGSLNVDVTNTVSVTGTVTSNQGTSPWVISGTVAATQSGTWNIGTLTSITNPVAVTGTFFQATQPISAVSLPLPTGAATAANQTNASQKTQIVDGSGNVIASTSNALNVDVTNFPATTAVTQSTSPWVVSGTITSNIGTTGGLALDATVAELTLAQGSTTSSQTGPLIQGAVTTSAPSYTTAQTSPLSLDTSGNLRVVLSSGSIEIGKVDQGNQGSIAQSWFVELTDGTNVLGTSAHPVRIDPTGTTTQPVSGTVTANAGTGTFTVGQATGTNLHTVVDSGSITVANATLAVTQSTSPWVISGTVTANAGTGNFTVVQPTGTNLHVVVDTAPTTAVTQSGTWTVQPGNTPNTTPWLMTIEQGGNAATVTASNALKVDGSAVTQPVSGTVAVTQSTSPWVVSLASTTITGTVTVAGNLTHNNAAPAANNVGVLPAVASSATPTYNAGDQVLLSTDLSGNLRVTIDGTVTEQNVNLNQVGGSAISIGQATMAASLPVVIASDQSSIPVSLTSTTITGTVAVTQSTSPWVISGTVTTTPPANASTNITQWDSVALGAPSAYGTSPGSVNVIGVNAFITNIPTVTANAGTGNFTVVQTTGTNLHTVVDSGSITVANASLAVTQSGTWTVQPGNTPNTSPWLMTISEGGNAATVTASNALKVDGSAVTQPISAVSLPLPTNAATSANQSTANATLSTIATNQTSGSEKSQIVDGSANVIGPVQTISGTNYFPVVQASSGATGSVVPSRTTQIGGSDGTDLRTLSTDTSGRLNINLNDGSGNSISSVSGSINENLTRVGGVAVVATAKATQASDFIPVQQPKDAGREYITLTADAIAGVTSETLITFTLNKQGTTTATQTNYTPTSGKTLRIQAIMIDVQSGAGAGGWVRVKLRHNTAGATTTSSALVFTAGSGTTNATAIASGIPVPIPDGLEIFGDGTQTIGITHLSSAITTVESITLVGYEY